LLAAVKYLFELEKSEHWVFVLCMADRMLGKSEDCLNLVVQLAVRSVVQAGYWVEELVHHLEVAAEDSVGPSVDQRCCNFAVVLTLEALGRPAATHVVA
jgi:hypothetical protein